MKSNIFSFLPATEAATETMHHHILPSARSNKESKWGSPRPNDVQCKRTETKGTNYLFQTVPKAQSTPTKQVRPMTTPRAIPSIRAPKDGASALFSICLDRYFDN